MIIKISKDETAFLKGIGIILIILHNYFHFVQPICGQNEFGYEPETFSNYLKYTRADYFNGIHLFFSYFGHYGVQFFIFLSGYGLAVQYYNKKFVFKEYLIGRIIKLYPVFTIALILWVLYQFLVLDMNFTIRTPASLFIRYTLIANLIPGKIFAISGPYWFYSMIFQLYIIFPLLLVFFSRHKYLVPIIVFTTYLLLILFNPVLFKNNFSLYYNFFGNVPVFAAGMFFALNENKKISFYLWFFAVLIFLAGQKIEILWHFSQISFIVVTLPGLLKIYRLTKKTFAVRAILFTGIISMYLFAVGGFMRLPWTDLSNAATAQYSKYLYFLIYSGIILVTALLIRKIDKHIMLKLKPDRKKQN